jgi:hypothetical protein
MPSGSPSGLIARMGACGGRGKRKLCTTDCDGCNRRPGARRRESAETQRGGASTAPSLETGSLGRGRSQFNGGWCRHQPPLSEQDRLAWVQQGIAAQALGGRRGRIPPASHPVCSTFVRRLRYCRGLEEEGLQCFAEARHRNRLPQSPCLCNALFSLRNSAPHTGLAKTVRPVARSTVSAMEQRSHANPSRAKRNPPVDK